MIELKPYEELNSLEKVARKVSGRVHCTDCPIHKQQGHRCNSPEMVIICSYAFEKGFVHGVKHHRKLIKNKTKKT